MRSFPLTRLVHAGRSSLPCSAYSLLGLQEGPHGWQSLRIGEPSFMPIPRMFASAANPSTRPPVSYLSFGLTAATGAGLLWYYQTMMNARVQDVKQATAGTASIGGPFDLIDQNGKPFTDKDLLGKFALVYFGFTHCPDICPDELEKMASALNGLAEYGIDGLGISTLQLKQAISCILMGSQNEFLGILNTGDQAKQIQPVFISIDPERDSVPQVREYVKEFYPGMVGLTGPVEKVKEAARQYRVYYTRAGDDDDKDYLIDHSIIMYLINPKGEFVTFYGKNYTAEQLQASLKGFLG